MTWGPRAMPAIGISGESPREKAGFCPTVRFALTATAAGADEELCSR